MYRLPWVIKKAQMSSNVGHLFALPLTPNNINEYTRRSGAGILSTDCVVVQTVMVYMGGSLMGDCQLMVRVNHH